MGRETVFGRHTIVRNALFKEALTDEELHTITVAATGGDVDDRETDRLETLGLLTAEGELSDSRLATTIRDLESYSEQTDGESGFGTFFGSQLRSRITDALWSARSIGRTGVTVSTLVDDTGGAEDEVRSILGEYRESHFVRDTGVSDGLGSEQRHLFAVVDGELADNLSCIQQAATHTPSGSGEAIQNQLRKLGWSVDKIRAHPDIPQTRCRIAQRFKPE